MRKSGPGGLRATLVATPPIQSSDENAHAAAVAGCFEKPASRAFPRPAGEPRPSHAEGCSTTLGAVLLERRRAIVEGWRDRIFRTYPVETATFLSREGDRFANPIGHAIVERTRLIVDALMEDADVDELGAHLEALVKPRAIQGTRPSRAVEFVFLLRDTIRDELRTVVLSPEAERDLRGLDDWLTRLAVHAFDVFCRCRETIHEIRVNEIKRSVSTLIRMHDAAGPGGPRSR